ncbi:LysR family transcriptional regulator [Sphingopyxis sp. 113P3]|uniref:LysR family transcriptional regulator n=1 Tax=Sphingopyxis sp. (strain 113P3) TaxID=292913 RepID=UPI0006BC8DE2|nr:LysR family transcriptional regulator [Sphingopyxis sp. 113P3]ALC14103.1 hypothetical protein LH20_19260 [Sphingopyxis sp. 113P3]
MDEGQLRAFMTILRCRSITRAADELGIAQPSLSHQLLRLEDELGTKLFRRSSRGVSATPAGLLFVDHAQRILDDIGQAREEIRTSSRGPAGEISLGIPVSLGPLIGPRVIAAVREELPNIRLRIRQGLASDLARLIVDDALDIALIYYAEELCGFPVEHLADEPLLLIGPPGDFGAADSRGVALQSVPVERLRQIDLLMLPVGKGLLRRINQQRHGEAIRRSIRTEIDALPTIKSMLVNGEGYSLLPLVGVREELAAGTLSAARIDGIDLNRSLSLARSAKRSRSRQSNVVETLLKRIFDDLRAEGLWLID